MKRRFFLMILILLALRSGAVAAPMTPEELLKAKGLTKVGAFYLLDGDIKLPEKLRLMRMAKHKVDESAARRMKLERDIEAAHASLLQTTHQSADLLASLPRIRQQDARRYNEVVGQIRELDASSLEAGRFIEARQKELAKIADPSDDYIKAVLDASASTEALASAYDGLAANDEVKKAIAAINARGGVRMRLGPSPVFISELPGVRKLREMVREAVIHFTLEQGVPTANVTINNDVMLPMTVDTGAALMTLSADAARKLGLKIDANAEVVKLGAADGKITDARLVKLENVRLGQFSVEGVECAVYPSSVNGMNLLGGTFLRNFVCRMDLAARELHMTQVAGTPSAAPAAAAKTAGSEVRPSALEKQDRAIKEAEEAYVKAVLAAKKEFLRDVAEDIRKAKDDPETLKRLEAAKKEAEQDVAIANFHSSGKLVVQINAVDDWKDVAPVRKGDVLEITANGTWSHNVKIPSATYGPAGAANGAYLEGKIGEKVYRINTGITITAESDGILSMRMNDSIREDNSGFVTVTISRKAE